MNTIHSKWSLNLSRPQLLGILLGIYLMIPISCSESFRCSDSCCDDEGFKQQYSRIDSMSIYAGKIGLVEFGSTEREHFIEEPSRNFEEAALRIRTDRVEYISRATLEENFSLSLLNGAYACSPPPPKTTQDLRSIEIFSDSSISSNDITYQAGEDLSNLFNVRIGYFDPEHISVEEFIDRQRDNRVDFGEGISDTILRLNKAVHFPKNTLTVKIVLDDDTEFVLSTDQFQVDYDS